MSGLVRKAGSIRDTRSIFVDDRTLGRDGLQRVATSGRAAPLAFLIADFPRELDVCT
jgi:hypothetical protein